MPAATADLFDAQFRPAPPPAIPRWRRAPTSAARGARSENPQLDAMLCRVERLRARARVSPMKPLHAWLGAEQVEAGLWRVVRRFPVWHRQGRASLAPLTAPVRDETGCLRWPNPLRPARLLFLETQTAGPGAAARQPLLVAMGRLEACDFTVSQYLLADRGAEPALLAALASHAMEDDVLVSFNGKGFDLPLLAARFRLHGLDCALAGLAHLDLLHALRRRFGASLPDCRLATAEQRLLGYVRESPDLPASFPRDWQRPMREGEGQGLARALASNRLDVLSTAALLPVLASPGRANGLVSLARRAARGRPGHR